MVTAMKSDCASLSKDTFLRKYTKPELLDFCSSMRVSGVSRLNKSQLYDACCAKKEIDVEKTREERRLEMKREREERARKDREKDELDRANFVSDVLTVQPSKERNVKTREMYKEERKERTPIGIFQRIGEGLASLGGGSPDDREPPKLPCPRSMATTVKWINQITSVDVSQQGIYEKSSYDTVVKGYYNGAVINREKYDFILVNEERINQGKDRVVKDLSKRFDVKKCFDVTDSKSGGLFGIFLKR